VAEVSTAVAHSLVHTPDRSYGSAAPIRPLLLVRQPSLKVAQPTLFARLHAHAVEGLAVAGGDWDVLAKVDTHRRQFIGQDRDDVIFDAKGDVPMALVALHGDVADCAAQWSAPAEANAAQLRKMDLTDVSAEAASFPDVNSVDETERRRPAPLATPPHAPDAMRPTGLVEIAQRLLETLRWGVGQPWFGVLRFGQLAALTGEAGPDCTVKGAGAVQLCGRAALVQSGIPDRAACCADTFGNRRLVVIQLEAIAPSTEHRSNPRGGVEFSFLLNPLHNCTLQHNAGKYNTLLRHNAMRSTLRPMIESVPRPTGSVDESEYGALTVRIPVELLNDLKAIAKKKERSLNFVAARVLKRGVDELRHEGWTDAQD